MEDPVVLLERNLYCHPLAGLLWERQCEKILLQHGLGEGFQLMNIDDKWSFQEWKSGEMLGARTERPVDDKFVIWTLTPPQNRAFL